VIGFSLQLGRRIALQRHTVAFQLSGVHDRFLELRNQVHLKRGVYSSTFLFQDAAQKSAIVANILEIVMATTYCSHIVDIIVTNLFSGLGVGELFEVHRVRPCALRPNQDNLHVPDVLDE